MNKLSSLLLLVTVLTGCDPMANDQANGGIGGSGGGNGGGDVAEGGIGGSGSGTTSGYGSLYINEHRYYQIAEDAMVWLDGELVSPTTINPAGQGLPLGLVAEFVVGEDANAEMTSGTIIRLLTNHDIIGPVTSLAPLTVLGQPVQTSADTLLDNVVVADLLTGQDIKVAGRRDFAGKVRATRLAEAAPFWQLVGRIAERDSTGFRIGDQRIELLSTPAITCDSALADGQQVLLRAQPEAGFTGGDALTTVTEIICLADGLSLFGEDAPATLPATTDGFITAITLGGGGLPVQVSLGGQQVDLTNVLPVLVATLTSLELGTHLEVDGVLETATGVLQARRLQLRDELALFEIIAPVVRLEDGSLLVLDQPLTGLPAADGSVLDELVDGSTARLAGFINSEGIVVVQAATVPEQTVSLRGAIQAVDEATGLFEVAGIPFRLDSADSVSLLGEDGVLINLLDSVLCNSLLPLLCPPAGAPEVNESLVGMLADISGAAAVAEVLEGGDLILTNPAP